MGDPVQRNVRFDRSMVGMTLTFLFFVSIATTTCSAWGNHAAMTRQVLAGTPWIEDLSDVVITPMSYVVEPMNPAYEFPFVEGPVGSTTNALTVLSTYADEPAWGPDQELKLSWQQTFMGGTTGVTSRGYIHCYYPAGSFNIPTPGIPMGMTPKRIEQIIALVHAAADRGDTYWALRFTAWCLHYIQDLTQPYHTTQTSPLFYWKQEFPAEFVKGTTKVTANYHFAYERFARWRVDGELNGTLPPLFVTALTEPCADLTVDRGLACFAKSTAKASHGLAKRAFRDSYDFFGPRFFANQQVLPEDADFEQAGPGDSKERLQSTMVEGFRIFAGATRALCDETRRVLDIRTSRHRDQAEALYGEGSTR